jgi:hypothetical protein
VIYGCLSNVHYLVDTLKVIHLRGVRWLIRVSRIRDQNMAGRADKGNKHVDEHSVEVSNPIMCCEWPV